MSGNIISVFGIRLKNHRRSGQVPTFGEKWLSDIPMLPIDHNADARCLKNESFHELGHAKAMSGSAVT